VADVLTGFPHSVQVVSATDWPNSCWSRE
jgi:hypothetical protein